MTLETTLTMTGVVLIAGAAVKVPKESVTAKREGITKVAVGFTAYVFGALILNELNAKLTQAFAFLFLVAALFYYGPSISKSLGSFLKA